MNYIEQGSIKGYTTSWVPWKEEASQVISQLTAEEGRLHYNDI